MNLSFRSSTILLFTALLVVTVTAVTFNNYTQARRGILTLTQQVIQGTVDQVLLRTTGVVQSAHRSLTQLALALRGQPLLTQAEPILEQLWNLNQQSPFYQSISIADRNGNLLQARKAPNLATRVNFLTTADPHEEWTIRDRDYQPLAHLTQPAPFNPLQQPWYQQVKPQLRPFWSDLYRLNSTGEYGVTLSLPVLDPDGGIEAVIGLDIALSSLQTLVTQGQIGNDSQLLIINTADQVLAYPPHITLKPTPDQPLPTVAALEQPVIATAYPLALAANQAGETGVLTRNIDGSTYFIQRTQLTRGFAKEWYLLLVVPDYEILATIQRGLYTSAMLALILLIIAAYSIYLIANRLSNPLQQVVENADRLEAFRFQELKPVSSSLTEFQQLDRAMQQMQRSLIAFNKYVPTTLIRQLLQNHRAVQLGGELRQLVLFNGEINGFARRIRALEPAQRVRYLARYQGEMVEVLHHHQATLDKFVEDRVIAFWGAPVTDSSGGYYACQGALDALHAIAELNQSLRSEQLPPMTLRIGLLSCELMVGNFGSEEQMFYSVLGDGVENGATLARLNKRYQTQILMDAELYRRVSHDLVGRWIDRTPLYEGGEAVDLYELRDRRLSGNQESPHHGYIVRYEAALTQRFIQQQPAEARRLLLELQHDYPDDAAIAWQLSTLTLESP